MLPRSASIPSRSLEPGWERAWELAGSHIFPSHLADVRQTCLKELIVVDKRRIRGFSRCQASYFTMMEGCLWLALPCSCLSPAGAGAALSF